MTFPTTIDSRVLFSQLTRLSGQSKKPAVHTVPRSRCLPPSTTSRSKVYSGATQQLRRTIRSHQTVLWPSHGRWQTKVNARLYIFVLLALSLASCSVESAPLLGGSENERTEHPSLYHKLAEITSQPLTAVSKLLLAVCLLLLLLSSIFVGLFAGAQHKINKIRHAPVPEPTTVSVTATQELPVTLTKTEISTSVSATTVISTTTAPAPPIPTPDPRTVCE